MTYQQTADAAVIPAYVPDAAAEMASEETAVCGSSCFCAAAAASDAEEMTTDAAVAAETTAVCGLFCFCAAAAASEAAAARHMPGRARRAYASAGRTFFAYCRFSIHIYNYNAAHRWVIWITLLPLP